ncbi:MAG TPA: hypothetical protein VFT22_15390, partial [Kofleriaceae bacterium]|nr:hypothetical protein [Kofleriaceae bacterium]
RPGGGDRVVAEPLGGEQAPVGLEADLPQRGQVPQPFADLKVAGVVDRGFGSDRFLELVVLLDLVAPMSREIRCLRVFAVRR